VLLHPWHGLLVYHPLYALGVAAAIWRIWRPVSAAERALWGVVLIALAAHVYLQASWFAWWLGTDTFGSRGLSVASVILVPALLRVLAGSGRAARVVGREAMVVAAAVCALWSYLLLLGGPSPRYATTQFYTWGALLEGQARTLAHLASPSMVLFQGAGVLPAAVTLPSSSAPRHHVLVRAASVMLGGFFLMDIRESYHEYLKVGGFEQKKAALRDFLTRQGAAP
jgi:hypothetical protein